MRVPRLNLFGGGAGKQSTPSAGGSDGGGSSGGGGISWGGLPSDGGRQLNAVQPTSGGKGDPPAPPRRTSRLAWVFGGGSSANGVEDQDHHAAWDLTEGMESIIQG
jgi:hypothetical protein